MRHEVKTVEDLDFCCVIMVCIVNSSVVAIVYNFRR